MSTDKKILSLREIIETKPLSISEILFSKTILNMAKITVDHKDPHGTYFDAGIEKVLVGDIRMLSGKSIEDSIEIAKLSISLWESLDVQLVDDITEVKISEVGEHILGDQFVLEDASNVFFNSELRLSLDISPIDRLKWAIEYLNGSLDFHQYWNFERTNMLVFNQDLGEGNIVEDDPYPDDIPVLIRLIMDACDETLITSKGNNNYAAIDVLESIKGVKHLTLEEDSFGPLICGIQTNNGTITYG